MRGGTAAVTMEREEYSAPLTNRRALVPPRRLRRALVAASVCLAVVGVAAGSFVLTQRGRSTAVGFEDVMTRFRTEQPAPGPQRPATQARPATPAAGTTAEDQDPTAGAVALALEAEEPPVAPQPYHPPDEGVYTYRATGGEKISLLGGKHDYPSRVHATVRHLGGCEWEFRNDVLREHVDILHLCSRPGALDQHSQTRIVEFFGTREGGTFNCEPPASFHRGVTDEPGATATATCSDGSGDTSQLTRTFVGLEETTVGSESLSAVHIVLDGKFDGSVTGTSQDRFWLAPETGLIYRWERTVDSIAKSFGANVRYTEKATFTLESLVPNA